MPWLGYIRLYFNRQGERLFCWPWSSELPCCEGPVGEPTWPGAEGTFQEPRQVRPKSQQEHGDLKHTAARSWVCQHLNELGRTFSLRASRGEHRLVNTLIPVLRLPSRGLPLDSDLQKLWDKECLFKATVCGNSLCTDIERTHLNLREPKLRESKKLAKVRVLIRGRGGIPTKVCLQIWMFNCSCFPTDTHE